MAAGWTSLALLITFFGGLTLLSLGIIGEYLWRILDEVRNRPNSVVDSVSDQASEGEEGKDVLIPRAKTREQAPKSAQPAEQQG